MYKAALSDGQDIAEALLEAEAKLGSMLAEIPKQYAISSIEGTNRPQRQSSLPPNITKKESHIAQTIANHPEVVEEAEQKAREQKRLVTIQELYKTIRQKKRGRNRRREGDPRKENNCTLTTSYRKRPHECEVFQ